MCSAGGPGFQSLEIRGLGDAFVAPLHVLRHGHIRADDFQANRFPIFIPYIQSVLLIENDTLNSEILSTILSELNIKFIGIPENLFAKSYSLQLIIKFLKSKGVLASNFPAYNFADKIILEPVGVLEKSSHDQKDYNIENVQIQKNVASSNDIQQENNNQSDNKIENTDNSWLRFTPIFINFSDYSHIRHQSLDKSIG